MNWVAVNINQRQILVYFHNFSVYTWAVIQYIQMSGIQPFGK